MGQTTIKDLETRLDEMASGLSERDDKIEKLEAELQNQKELNLLRTGKVQSEEEQARVISSAMKVLVDSRKRGEFHYKWWDSKYVPKGEQPNNKHDFWCDVPYDVFEQGQPDRNKVLDVFNERSDRTCSTTEETIRFEPCKPASAA